LKLEEVDELRRRLAPARPLAPHLEERVEKRLEPRYVWASNSIEDPGCMSLEETSVFLERGITAAGRFLLDFQALTQHRLAYRDVLRRAAAKEDLTLDLIRSIHKLVTLGLTDKDYGPGEWKTKPNKTASRRGYSFHYSSPEAVPDLMARLTQGLKERLLAKEHLIEATAWFCYHFHVIHPFNEANGRVIRLLATFLLVRAGYVPLIIEAGDRGLYLDKLRACDTTVPAAEREALNPKVDVRALVEFITACVGHTLGDVLEIVEERVAENLGEIGARAAVGQQAVLAQVAADAPDVAWRSGAGDQVRALHQRVVDALAKARVNGPLYSIVTSSGELTADHSSSRAIRSALPAGCGLVGETTLTLLPNATSPLKLPITRTLTVAVTATRYALHLITRWEDELEATQRHGPTLAEQWSQTLLERHLALRIDPSRQEYDAEIVDKNRPAALRAVLREAQVDTGTVKSFLASATAKRAAAESARAELEREPTTPPSSRPMSLGGKKIPITQMFKLPDVDRPPTRAFRISPGERARIETEVRPPEGQRIIRPTEKPLAESTKTKKHVAEPKPEKKPADPKTSKSERRPEEPPVPF
jgi:fido (protein-threonine AMPylation protein)